MTEQNREFLQETAFEEDVNLDAKKDDYWQSDDSKKAVAAKFAQWLHNKNK